MKTLKLKKQKRWSAVVEDLMFWLYLLNVSSLHFVLFVFRCRQKTVDTKGKKTVAQRTCNTITLAVSLSVLCQFVSTALRWSSISCISFNICVLIPTTRTHQAAHILYNLLNISQFRKRMDFFWSKFLLSFLRTIKLFKTSLFKWIRLSKIGVSLPKIPGSLTLRICAA